MQGSNAKLAITSTAAKTASSPSTTTDISSTGLLNQVRLNVTLKYTLYLTFFKLALINEIIEDCLHS